MVDIFSLPEKERVDFLVRGGKGERHLAPGQLYDINNQLRNLKEDDFQRGKKGEKIQEAIISVLSSEYSKEDKEKALYLIFFGLKRAAGNSLVARLDKRDVEHICAFSAELSHLIFYMQVTVE
ncbi:MAG TPA: hypothetical protein DCX32_03945 [Candidatus Moranbacteria bacterium]|nr:MAG: hypothetical protein UW87_C0013G0005 [Candidatus Moranbacteria bacterium GW2011_GWC2_45_10]KKT94979.1 MAG: hypothetical protein UW95_C0006G0044 [Parcubacteria group bacterium GW2011_GWC1_45_14]HAV11660.1 hypothetical protein [Candidatus Moranbacteria bacterium]